MKNSFHILYPIVEAKTVMYNGEWIDYSHRNFNNIDGGNVIIPQMQRSYHAFEYPLYSIVGSTFEFTGTVITLSFPYETLFAVYKGGGIYALYYREPTVPLYEPSLK